MSKSLCALIKELSEYVSSSFFCIKVNMNIDYYRGKTFENYYRSYLCRVAIDMISKGETRRVIVSEDLDYRYGYFRGSIEILNGLDCEENYEITDPPLYSSIRRLVGVIKCCLC